MQEVKPPSSLPQHTIIFEENYQGWGTAIYAPAFALSADFFSVYPKRVVAATIMFNGWTLLIVSIHAPIINGRVFPHLNNIFAELESKQYGRSTIVGGDLNTARLAEKVWPKHGHGPFFERIDSGNPWIDCCRQFHPEEIQTFFRDTCANPFQDDHIFISNDLSDCLKSCDVINNDITRNLSDHIPLIAELDLSCANMVAHLSNPSCTGG